MSVSDSIENAALRHRHGHAWESLEDTSYGEYAPVLRDVVPLTRIDWRHWVGWVWLVAPLPAVGLIVWAVL